MNHNGVITKRYSVGSCFEVRDSSGNVLHDAESRSLWVPNICLSCHNFDPGEYGDYGGGQLSPPYCLANIWWPTRKGTCAKYDGYRYTWHPTLNMWVEKGLTCTQTRPLD